MRFSRPVIAICATLLLCGAGCVAGPELTPQPNTSPAPSDGPAANVPTAARQKSEPWHRVADGAERSVIVDAASGIAVVLYRFDASQFQVQLLSAPDAPKPVSEWAGGVAGDHVVINGTYFNDDHAPSGFVALAGVRVGTRSFDLDKSGLMIFGSEFRIIDTKAQKTELAAEKLGEAAQSYPFYFVDGKPAISKDSGQVSRRSFIGQDVQGRTYVGAVPEDFVSLYALMRMLENAGVEWRNVLNLDGGPSTGLVATFDGTGDAHDSFDAVPNVIVVRRRAR